MRGSGRREGEEVSEVNQFIVICLDDEGRYVQASLRRLNESQAKDRVRGVHPSRSPIIVPVPAVVLDKRFYPERDENGHFIPIVL